MRVCLVTIRTYPEVGGIENYTFYLANALNKRGIDVEIITTNVKNYTGGRIERGNYPKEEVVEGVKYKRVTCLNIKNPVENRFPPGIFFELSKSQPDIIHSCGLGTAAAISLLFSKIYKVPHVITPFFHPPRLTIESSGTRHKILWNLITNLRKRSLIDPVINKSEKVVAVSQTDKEILKNIFNPKSIVVLPYGINVKDFTEAYKGAFRHAWGLKDEKMILFVGELSQSNGILDLLKAYKMVQEKIENTKLVLIGRDTGQGNLLERFARNLGLSKNLLYAGILPHKEVIEAFRDADLFVIPSYYETFGVVNIEAMASGTPVIVSNRGANPELVDDSVGRVCKYGDWVDLKNKMLEILENNVLRDRMAKNGEQKAKKFDWNVIVDRYILMYEELV